MAFTVDDLLEGVRKSRSYFLRHLDGLREDQWDWKPYQECMSIRETLAHLIVDDRMALQSMQTGQEPDYETASAEEYQAERMSDLGALRARLADSHEQLCEYILERYANGPLDAECCIWGGTMTVGAGVAYFSSEDFYHAGQVAFIRMATDPAWVYYGSIYGGG